MELKGSVGTMGHVSHRQEKIPPECLFLLHSTWFNTFNINIYSRHHLEDFITTQMIPVEFGLLAE